MAMNFNNGYGYNPYNTNQFSNLQTQYTSTPTFTTTFVSDIAEAIATKPDVTGKPLFFYNKLAEEIYVKQYDNTGSAPVKTYKLVVEAAEPVANPVLDGIRGLNNQLNDIKKLLTPEVIEETEKRNRR